MPQYAIEEVNSLISGLNKPLDVADPMVRYVCALFAELAYYHIPAYEIDDKKRAMLIPCDAYQKLIRPRKPADLNVFLNTSQFEGNFFVIEDRGVIAVGALQNKILFIGFRGTRFLFDWIINVRAELVHVNSLYDLYSHPRFYHRIGGRLHSGFAEEALRISLKISDKIRSEKIRNSKFDDIEHVFFAGHSLGGAVAAIASNYLPVAPSSVCMFGAPRYADVSAYYLQLFEPPTQIRRRGDLVPTIPPKILGYCDNPYEFDTKGNPFIEPIANESLASESWQWIKFLAKRAESHSIEKYRQELGEAAGAIGATCEYLTDYKKLKRQDLK